MNNLFSTKKAIEQNVSKNVPFMPAGVHENVTLKNVVVDTTTHGTQFIRFDYVNSDGLEMKNSEFEPTKRHYEDDEAFAKRVSSQVRRMMNNYIIPYYGYKDGVKYTEEELKSDLVPQFEDGGFFAFINWIKAQIEDVAKTTPLRIKVVYDNKNWLGLPNYNKYVSVEPMSADKREITLLSIDQITPYELDDENKKEGDPFSSVAVNPAIENDLLSTTMVSETPSGLPF